MGSQGNASRKEEWPSQEELTQAIHNAQLAMALAKAYPDDAQIAEVVREALYVLFSLVFAPLKEVAKGWTRGHLYKDARSSQVLDDRRHAAHDATHNEALDIVARQAFLYVVEKLHTIKVDPEQNVVNLIKTIASRGISAEHKRMNRNDISPPIDPSLSMAPLKQAHRFGVYSETGELLEPADPESLDYEPLFFRRIVGEECVAAVLCWLRTIPPEHAYIFQARFLLPEPI